MIYKRGGFSLMAITILLLIALIVGFALTIVYGFWIGTIILIIFVVSYLLYKSTENKKKSNTRDVSFENKMTKVTDIRASNNMMNSVNAFNQPKHQFGEKNIEIFSFVKMKLDRMYERNKTFPFVEIVGEEYIDLYNVVQNIILFTSEFQPSV